MSARTAHRLLSEMVITVNNEMARTFHGVYRLAAPVRDYSSVSRRFSTPVRVITGMYVSPRFARSR